MLVREVRPDCPRPVHGTRYAYRKGCRCDDTMTSKRGYDLSWRRRHGRPARCQGTAGPRVTRAIEADWVMVDRLVRGIVAPNTRHVDRHAAIDILDRRGWTAREIARQVGTTKRSVERQRQRCRAREGTR